MKRLFPHYHYFLKRFLIFKSDTKTACNYWDIYLKKFVIEYNPKFVEMMSVGFGCNMEEAYRMVLIHEMKHTLKRHVSEYTNSFSDEMDEFANIVQDMFINTELVQEGFISSYPIIGLSNYMEIKGTACKTFSPIELNKLFKGMGILNTHDSLKEGTDITIKVMINPQYLGQINEVMFLS